nr:PocR ligand-binding domain-containing protein [Chloroflexota bacterium]
MIEDGLSNRAIQKILLDIFASSTQLPIGLFDLEDHISVFGSVSLSHFEQYCQLVQGLPGGSECCERDEWHRVRVTKREGLTLCHAGLYNYALPIFVDNQRVAVLLCGEMRIADPDFEQRSLTRHEEFLRHQYITEETEEKLRQAFARTKRVHLQAMEKDVLSNLHQIENWYYRLTSSQRALAREKEDMTHELQIGLQGLLAEAENLYLDLLRERDIKREYKEAAREVLNRTIALDSIIQRFGDFIGSYRFSLVPLAKIVHESRRVYQEEAKQRGITIKIQLEPVNGRSPVIQASQEHLQQAMHNLVHNAIKYSFTGAFDRPRWVQIVGRPAGKYYELRIQNFGVGIDPDEYDKIFQGGYQGRRTRDEYRPGSGRGLALVKRVIEKHHGEIMVSSVDQKSAFLTTFTVLLPYTQPFKED